MARSLVYEVTIIRKEDTKHNNEKKDRFRKSSQKTVHKYHKYLNGQTVPNGNFLFLILV